MGISTMPFQRKATPGPGPLISKEVAARAAREPGPQDHQHAKTLVRTNALSNYLASSDLPHDVAHDLYEKSHNNFIPVYGPTYSDKSAVPFTVQFTSHEEHGPDSEDLCMGRLRRFRDNIIQGQLDLISDDPEKTANPYD